MEVLYTLPCFCSTSKNALLPLIKELVTSHRENAKACPNHVEFFPTWVSHQGHSPKFCWMWDRSERRRRYPDLILMTLFRVLAERSSRVSFSWMILQPAYQVIYMPVVPNVGTGLLICTITLLIILSMLHVGKNVWSFINDYSRGKRDFQIATLYLRDIFNI